MNRNGVVSPFFKVRDKGDLKRTIKEYMYGAHAAKCI
jgi:hypothetical protein